MLLSVIQLFSYNVQFNQTNFEININDNNYNVIENSDLEDNEFRFRNILYNLIANGKTIKTNKCLLLK